jgi:predicted nucleic acid-binding protein
MPLFLPDVNVWIGLAVIEHAQHREAIRWFESASGEKLA